MMVSKFLCALLIALLAFATTPAVAKSAKPITNRDVINLVHAKITPDSILLLVEKSKPGLDTSATAVIELSKQGLDDARAWFGEVLAIAPS
jgi:hypothetical protein